ncbi:hypothetical protein Gotri_027890, partial [Gossypium trilobum]|nr:hypothetical protein [Gossypium trilobum]
MASSFSHTALRLLLSSAKAIEDGDLKSADAFLHDILILADQRPYWFHDEYLWESNIDAWEGNNVIRRHQTLSEWQRLFSVAGFTRIPLIHRKSVEDESWLEIMREEEECLILGNKGCP